LRFFSKSKKRDILRFSELLHTFSPTLLIQSDAEDHVIQHPKASVTTTPAAAAAPAPAAAGPNPNEHRASAIDRYSRVVFPVIFTVFSITYWAIYINASSSMINLAGFVVD